MGLRSCGEPCIPPSADFTCDRASLYLDDLREALGAMLDVGVTVCGLSGQDVVDAFVVSGVSREFERLNPAFVAGKSGIELVRLLAPFMGTAGDPLESAGVEYPFDRFGRSPDYWLGWSLGYFQVVTGLPYARVVRGVGLGFAGAPRMTSPSKPSKHRGLLLCNKIPAQRGLYRFLGEG